MKNLLIIPILLSSVLIGCREEKKNIFWISEPDGQENDLLFMAESTNIPPIETDSLIYYLTNAEMVSAEKLTFKNFGTIHKCKTFDVIVLLKEGSDRGRNYTFIVRTIDDDFNIIDSYELAMWIDSENRYCFGSINDELAIKRTCGDGKEVDLRQIENDGRIVPAFDQRR